jgi:hypothetical protein
MVDWDIGWLISQINKSKAKKEEVQDAGKS